MNETASPPERTEVLYGNEKILKLDINVRVCFMSAGEINQEAIREVHLTKSIGCFIKKPIMADVLVERLKAELG